jgi:uncharacterized membrane protein YphA (DoxX/SURF4 family)
MAISAKLRRAPLRITTGALILNAGASKFGADDDSVKKLHGMAVNTFPVVEKVEPRVFVRALSAGEMALGAALLLPIVPPAVAGLGLAAFAGSLLTVWWRMPGMHLEGSPRPTQQGMPYAKDAWMFGAGASLVADALTTRAHDRLIAIETRRREKHTARAG